MTFIHKLRSTKAANLTEYGLVVGLIAVASIGAVITNGEEVKKVFCTAANGVGENTAAALGNDFTPLQGCELGEIALGSGSGSETPVTPAGPGTNTAGQEAFTPTGDPGLYFTRASYTNISTIDLHVEGNFPSTDIIFEKAVAGTWEFVDSITNATLTDGGTYTFDLNDAAGLEHGIYGLFRITTPTLGETRQFFNVETGVIMAMEKGNNNENLSQEAFQGPEIFVELNGQILIGQQDRTQSNATGTIVDRLWAYDINTGEASLFIDDYSADNDFLGSIVAAGDNYIMTEGRNGRVLAWDSIGNNVVDYQLTASPLTGAAIDGDILYVSYRRTSGLAQFRHNIAKFDLSTGQLLTTSIYATNFISEIGISNGILYVTNSATELLGFDTSDDSIAFTIPGRHSEIWANDSYVATVNASAGQYEFFAGGTDTSLAIFSIPFNGGIAPWSAGVSGNMFYVTDHIHDNQDEILGINMDTGTLTERREMIQTGETDVTADINYHVFIDSQGDIWTVSGLFSGSAITPYNNGIDATYSMRESVIKP